MSAAKKMSGLRRRSMPGMPSEPISAIASCNPVVETVAAPQTQSGRTVERRGADGEAPAAPVAPSRCPSQDYSATRLINFRLPVDLHDRYRQLVLEVERAYPRLRRPSLTEVLIGLLEEGPVDVDEVAEVIRRKRAGEYAEDPS